MQPANPISQSGSVLPLCEASQIQNDKIKDKIEEIYPYGLTEPEILFLKTIEDIARIQLKRGIGFYYMNEALQKSFQRFVKRKLIAKSFTDKELNLHIIIPSLWEKAKIHLEAKFLKQNNPSALENELKSQRLANDKDKLFLSKGRPGRCFTIKQLQLLMSVFTKSA